MLAPHLALSPADLMSDRVRHEAKARRPAHDQAQSGSQATSGPGAPPLAPPQRSGPVYHTLEDMGDSVARIVATAYGLSQASLTAPGRDPVLVEARTVFMALLAERGLGSSSIGRIVGRDHSTVLHHLEKLTQGATPELMDMLEDCRGRVARVPWLQQYSVPHGAGPLGGRTWTPRSWRPSRPAGR